VYPPKQFQEFQKDKLIEIIKNYPLATVISVSNNIPFITHLPLIFKNDVLYGHIDKHNPQASLLQNNNEVTLIFSGPQSYISPSLFNSNQLPTWNYVKLHVTGKVSKIETNDAIKQSIVEMTDRLESPKNAYRLNINDERMEHLVHYISGFKIEDLKWEGKLKMSQDKPMEEFYIAKNEVIQSNKKDLEAFLNVILAK
jgi:transcriptional regulator